MRLDKWRACARAGVLLASALLAGCSRPGAQDGSVTKRLEELEQQQARDRAEIERLSAEVRKADDRLTVAEGRAEALDKWVGVLFDVIKEWSETHASELEKATKANPALAWKLLAASANLAAEKVKAIEKVRVEFNAELEKLTKPQRVEAPKTKKAK